MRACGNFWDVPDCTFVRFCTLLYIFCGIFNTFQGDYFFYSHIFDNILPSKTNMKKFLHAKSAGASVVKFWQIRTCACDVRAAKN